jgi:UDP-N-acetylmuramyl tripeptide synthase
MTTEEVKNILNESLECLDGSYVYGYYEKYQEAITHALSIIDKYTELLKAMEGIEDVIREYVPYSTKYVVDDLALAIRKHLSEEK